MLQYIGHHGIVVREQHHTSQYPVSAIVFVDSGDTDFDPGFRINVNGDKPIPILKEFETLPEIAEGYHPREGGGLDQADIMDILDNLDWLGYAYTHKGPGKFGRPRLLLISNPSIVDMEQWEEISTRDLKTLLNVDYKSEGEPLPWK